MAVDEYELYDVANASSNALANVVVAVSPDRGTSKLGNRTKTTKKRRRGNDVYIIYVSKYKSFLFLMTYVSQSSEDTK